MLSVDGKEVERKTIEHTIPILMTLDENVDVGADTRSWVDDFFYLPPFPLPGTIDKLTVTTGPARMMPADSAKVATGKASADN